MYDAFAYVVVFQYKFSCGIVGGVDHVQWPCGHYSVDCLSGTNFSFALVKGLGSSEFFIYF